MSLFFCGVITCFTFTKIITSYCVVFFFLFPFYRTILAALHFSYNLKRGSKVHDDGEPVLLMLHVPTPNSKRVKPQ